MKNLRKIIILPLFLVAAVSACGKNTDNLTMAKEDTIVYLEVSEDGSSIKPESQRTMVGMVRAGFVVERMGKETITCEWKTINGERVLTNYMKVKLANNITGWVYAGYFQEPVLYSMVEQANVRDTPSSDVSGFTALAEGESVIFLGERSDTTATYTLRGNEVTSNFFKVLLNDGQEGWVFAGVLSMNPGEVMVGNVPLWVAVLDNDYNTAEDLLESGDSLPDERNYDWDDFRPTPIFSAVYNENKNIVELLIDYGADVEWENPDGYQPLYYAIENGNDGIAEMLIAEMDNITSYEDAEGNNYLHLAAKSGNLKIVKAVMAAGVSFDAFNDDDMSPYQIAVNEGYGRVASYLSMEND